MQVLTQVVDVTFDHRIDSEARQDTVSGCHVEGAEPASHMPQDQQPGAPHRQVAELKVVAEALEVKVPFTKPLVCGSVLE